jgi:uncharacterized protein (TIGR04255 family)
MPDSLGAWTNAPLAYALAEVRTERLADIRTYQPTLAGRFREQYPLQRTMQTTKLVATGMQLLVEADQDPAWEFATTDNRTALVVRPNGIVLHATAYRDAKTFLADLSSAVNIFAEVVPSVFVARIGLRHVDFVLPRDGEEPEAYVDRRLNPDLGLTKLSDGTNTMSLGIYRMPGGVVLSLRYVRARGKPELPPDLAGLSLDKSHLMESGVVPETRATALLDFDCNMTYERVARLEPTKVQEQFAAIYNISFNAFMASITDHGRKVWGARP